MCTFFCLFSDKPSLQLKTNRDAYDGYVPMAYDDYLEKVARSVPHHAKQFFFRMEHRLSACGCLSNMHFTAYKLTEMVNGVTM